MSLPQANEGDEVLRPLAAIAVMVIVHPFLRTPFTVIPVFSEEIVFSPPDQLILTE